MVATLKQVAPGGGVSHQGAWRAIHRASAIPGQTRLAGLDIAPRWRCQGIAGGLRTLPSSSIGLVVPDVRPTHAGEPAPGVAQAAARGGGGRLQ